jgi:nucleoid DNA-binding protein
MNRGQVIEAMLEKAPGAKRKDISVFLDAFTMVVTEEVSRNGDVTLAKFGKFSKKVSAPRIGRNIRTGETIEISAREYLVFKQAKGVLGSVEAETSEVA